jgi:hypothetical protein
MAPPDCSRGVAPTTAVCHSSISAADESMGSEAAVTLQHRRNAPRGYACQSGPRYNRETHVLIAAGEERQRKDPLRCKGPGGTPGGTRIPNLLIRRSPKSVHSRPQPSTAVQSYWLPDWLPEQVTGHTYPVRSRPYGRFPIRPTRVLRSCPTRFDPSANPRYRVSTAGEY